MNAWNFNIDEAPRDTRVILASVCGKVLSSQYLTKAARWEMLAKDEQPVAWQHWPEHPALTATIDLTRSETVKGEKL